jgi:hypothetical protein
MRPWLSDAWSLLALAFGQIILTVVFIALVPYGYLTQRARTDTAVESKLKVLEEYGLEHQGDELTWTDILRDEGTVISELLEAVPCGWLVTAGIVLIYPFLGWWAGRWLHHPQLAGLLILGSIGTQQNIVMVPRNVEYMNVAPISLSLPVVMVLITLEFVLLTAGILAQRGQVLIEKERQI